VTPEDGLDETPRIRANVFSQSVVVTHTMDLCGEWREVKEYLG
jgi:hypothetical protein